MMRARLGFAIVSATLAGMVLAPANAAGPFTVSASGPGIQLGTAQAWRISGQFAGTCASPGHAIWTDKDVPGIDSKGVEVATLGLGSATSARRVKLQITSSAPPGGLALKLDVGYFSDSIPTLPGCRSIAQSDSGNSPLTVTVPSLAKWIVVAPTGGPAANIQFTANKV